MTNHTDRTLTEVGGTVLDPTLSVWQRRYFHQPATGPGRRAFTAARARRGYPLPGRVVALFARWDAARDRETSTRGRARWI